MAPHRALAIPDILHEIFAHVNEGHEACRIETLENSVAVCRSFYSAVLPFWWSRLSILRPLRLFSSFRIIAVGEEPDPAAFLDEDQGAVLEYDIYALTDDIPDHERERFTHYAQYVRQIWNDPSPYYRGWSITSRSWALIEKAFGDQPLFPNLQYLRWVVDVSAPRAILNFLTPSITYLYIACQKPLDPDAERLESREAVIDSILRSACAVAKHTEELKMKLAGVRAISSAVLEPVYGLQRLRSFTFTAYDVRVDYDALHRLSAMDSLEFLSIKFNIHVSDVALRPLAFQHLNSLRIRHFPGDSLALNQFSSPVLAKLDIWNYEYVEPQDLRRSCAAWARSFPSLRDLRICCETQRRDPAAAVPRPSLAQTIGPLLSVRTLENLELLFQNTLPLAVRDEDIVAMSTAWPALTTLNLKHSSLHPPSSSFRWQESFNPSTISLSSLAARCPNLRELMLSGFECRLRTESDLGDLPRRDHRLEKLFLGEMKVEDMTVLAHFLDRTFPHVQQVWQKVMFGVPLELHEM